MTAVIDNERKACDAVIRSLERLGDSIRCHGHSPEDDGAENDVEFVCDLGGIKYAFEHTTVEAFDGQIQSDRDFSLFVEPITQALDAKLPKPGLYHLYFPIDPSSGMKPKSISRAQEELIRWVNETSAALHSEHQTEPAKAERRTAFINERQESVAGIGVRLVRETRAGLHARFNGRLFVARFAPEDYEMLRLKRLVRAMEKKLPKLQKRKQGGARTILVLENRDMALSNHMMIMEAAERAMEKRSDKPDEVWLVDTTIEHEWTAWCLIRDGVAFPDDETALRYHDYDPKELQEIG